MKIFLPAFILFISPVISFSQARMVINGGSQINIVENGGTAATPIYIVIGNSNSNALTTLGAGNAYINSEAEFNMIKWNIGTATGTYVIPFGYKTSFSIPYTATISTAGVGAGSVLFSTWETDPDNGWGTAPYNVFPYHIYPDLTPSDVTNMGAAHPPGGPSLSDDSYNVVDRFWIMDPLAFPFTTNPTISNQIFFYIHTGGTNEYQGPNITAHEGNLQAQRFNSTLHTWGDYIGAGTWTSFGQTKQVTNPSGVSPANFFRSWTLSNSLDPLPIDLSSFTAQCENGSAIIQWTTQSELNNDYFAIEKTTDNIHFETVGANIPGAGTTSLPSNYSIIDDSPFAGQSYYLLFQTDLDGNRTQSADPIEFNGCNVNGAVTTIKAYNTPNNIQVQINSVAADNFNISLVNMLGQTIFSGMHAVALGNNNIILPANMSSGVYVLNVKNDKINYSKKLIIGVK